MTETISSAVAHRIITGHYKPGEHLVSDTLAAEFGISRLPVRDALTRLSTIGLVELFPHRGAFVLADQSVESFREVLDIRATIEPWVMARAAEKWQEDDLVAVQTTWDAGRQASIDRDNVTAAIQHTNMLEALTSAAHHRIASTTLDPLHKKTAVLFIRTVGTFKTEGWDGHHQILEAVTNRDPGSVRELTRQHLDGFRRTLDQ
ncbi:MAG: GntR family transcriptional regulator [Rhodococcus sp. (in: high G+C Gram-positive bacteria)]|uniref:GntR family transcriptional regulator n=1 Tax=Rhodococcus sp. TaxID=1831 RepID=UPI002ADA2D3F|nr:GntR family transcriptional regulator [Rhodococcus sp. (in: high G+C Gram-positive bacteria)]